MNRRTFLQTSAGWVSALLPSQGAPAGRPNVVVIVADDLGYMELGVQGCPDVPTPNIDSIAKNGVRFTQGYVTCPICAPTRAGLMTGRYQQRFGCGRRGHPARMETRRRGPSSLFKRSTERPPP